MSILGLAAGVALGFFGFKLLELFLLDLPLAYIKYLAERKKKREIKQFMDEALTGFIKHMESDEHKAHVKGANSERTSSKTAKKASTSASKPQRKAGSSTRSRATKVQTAKKGAK